LKNPHFAFSKVDKSLEQITLLFEIDKLYSIIYIHHFWCFSY